MKIGTALATLNIFCSIMAVFPVSPVQYPTTTYPTAECDDGGMTMDMSLYCYAFQESIELCCAALNARVEGCQERFRPKGDLFPSCAKFCGLCLEAFVAVDRKPSNTPTLTPTAVQVPTQTRNEIPESEKDSQGKKESKGKGMEISRHGAMVTIFERRNSEKRKRDNSAFIIAAGIVSAFAYSLSTFLMYCYFFGKVP